MTVNRLDNNRVLIILGTKDMNELSINFEAMDFSDRRSRIAVMGIMQKACLNSGIETNGKRMNIEILFLDDDCYFLVTVGEKKHTYRMKEHSAGVCCQLGNIDCFLDAVEQLYRQNVCCGKNSAYELDGEYYLVFDYPTIPKKLRAVVYEYGTIRKSRLFISRLAENGSQICRRNAIEQIGRSLV